MKFDLALPDEEALLRTHLWQTPMEGAVDLVFAREPNYFHIGKTQGDKVQTFVGKSDGKIKVSGIRATRLSQVNGQVQETGYLADFRIAKSSRNGFALLQANRFLKKLHQENPIPYYSAVIGDDNERALTSLASNYKGFPRFRDYGRVLTPLLFTMRNLKNCPKLEGGSLHMLPEICAKLNENKQQLAPYYTVSDFTSGKFPNFKVEDFLILKQGSKIKAVAALWDQSTFRQTVPIHYGGYYRWLRPMLNYFLSYGLPKAGQHIKTAYMAFVASDNIDDHRILLRACLQSAKIQGYTHLVTGIHERDERAPLLAEFPGIPYAGRLFLVDYDNHEDLDDRVPYVEVATL
ncbi:hypothetical protein [Legionella bononiensis]|uniref:N-acetyltransferase domain-containing protein n=1 Tax=Legionella bononiensis TaxID=2793102 RepID=A0ABS1WFN8_9GAMM|nr:hypothetical protein [Legionella bononiensis]MBL7481608.1 hypothetical protein [Legionella bononiensis]MBL7528155.1 hypothetical protein [Legionella bononiensis]MBL7562631.1 hypothetical protein [Legionella bononiensis]